MTKRSLNLTKASSTPGHSLLRTISGSAFARLLAQEYVRNGMDIQRAHEALTGRPLTNTNTRTLQQMTRGHMDEFVDEIRVQLANADIELAPVLHQLWTMLQTSLLDFFADDGRVLPMSELKKLPRCVQAIIHTVEVKSVEMPVQDQAGNTLVDDNGRPYLRLEQQIKVAIPNKLDAIRQLAALMKWTGPDTVVNIGVVNIGAVMASADDRRRRLERIYEATPAPIRTDVDDPAA